MSDLDLLRALAIAHTLEAHCRDEVDRLMVAAGQRHLSYASIGRAMGISPEAARQRVVRGRRKRFPAYTPPQPRSADAPPPGGEL